MSELQPKGHCGFISAAGPVRRLPPRGNINLHLDSGMGPGGLPVGQIGGWLCHGVRSDSESRRRSAAALPPALLVVPKRLPNCSCQCQWPQTQAGQQPEVPLSATVADSRLARGLLTVEESTTGPGIVPKCRGRAHPGGP